MDTTETQRRRGHGEQTRSPGSIVIEDLTRVFHMGKVPVRALDGISLTIDDGSMVCIMGKSGSGKSTLLRQLGLIDEPTSGTIVIGGEDASRMRERRRAQLRLVRLGYVFQEYALLPELTAQENVYLPALMAGQRVRACEQRARELLDVVGLGDRLSHRPREMSGGEQQRVAIARALVNEPGIVFADEPTANLDSLSARVVMETLVQLNESVGVTVVFVSHDPDDKGYASRVIVLEDGKLSKEQS